MYRISALNEETEQAADDSTEGSPKGTKEAQEAQAFNLYNEALCLQQNNKHDEAVKVYEQLLTTSLVIESASTLVNEHNEAIEHPLKDPGLILKYSTHKNVANIFAGKGDINTAMEHYLQAVMLDTSDVTLWYKIGVLASQLSNLILARHAFTQGLGCNPKHWPCLDSLVTVLYAMLDYEYCLYWISKAFQLDPLFRKGIILRRKVISECPHLQRDTQHLFTNFGSAIFELEVSEDEEKEVIDEAMTLRENRRKLRKEPEIPLIPLAVPLQSFTWLDLVKCLIATYNEVRERPHPIDETCPIDLDILDKVKQPSKDVEMQDVDATPPSSETASTSKPSTQQDSFSASAETSVLAGTDSMDTSILSSQGAVSGDGLGQGDDSQTSADTEQPSQDGTSLAESQNSHKKTLKRKRFQQEKVVEQEQQQNKRRSSRMKKAASRTQFEPPDQEAELDFRQSLLQLLPASLLPDRAANAQQPETNRQDSADVPNTNQSQNSTVTETTGATGQVASTAIEPQKISSAEATDTTATINPQIDMDLDHTAPHNTANTSGRENCSGSKTENQASKSVGNKPDGEANEVRQFIKANAENRGALGLLDQFCYKFGAKAHLKWNNGIREYFITVYRRTRGTLVLKQFSSEYVPNEHKRMYTNYILTFLECWFDSQVMNYVDDPTYLPSPRDGEDMFYLSGAAVSTRDVFDGDENPFYRWLNFIQRYHWMKVQWWMMQGMKDQAVRELRQCAEWAACAEKEGAGGSVSLPNLKHHNVITQDTIKARIASLERMQTAKNVEAMFQADRHSDIVDLIEPMLGISGGEIDSKYEDITGRPVLLEYFMQSALKVNEPTRTFRCLVATLHAATRSVTGLSESSKAKQKDSRKKEGKIFQQWRSLILTSCKHIDEIIDKNAEVLSSTSKPLMVKLTEALLAVIHLGMNQLQLLSNVNTGSAGTSKYQASSSKADNLSLQSLSPWILLFKLLKFNEDKGFQYEDSSKKSGDEAAEKIMPGSIKLLLTAHDWLGDRGICCMDGGKFLRLIVKNVLPHLKRSVCSVVQPTKQGDALPQSGAGKDSKKILRDEIEQCFFCMFNYPNKLQKSSRLIDHSSQQTHMRWADAVEIFRYFRPDALPGFDSYKVNTMVSELATLKVKILKLLPDDLSTALKASFETLGNFIRENDIGAELDFSLSAFKDNEGFFVVKDIYYLLADYNFKNKEMFLAARYYMHDLCVNPTRFDSWAGLALAESSQVDDRLRFCVTKPYDQHVGETLEVAKNALFCFKKAVSLDKSNATLWIEFGSLAYWVHSNYSRQLQLNISASDDESLAFEKEKAVMLDLALQCFQSALDIDVEDANNEEWLIQYMLGKVHEKKRSSPQEYLRHYNRSAMLLHRKHAKYPKKIQFKSYQSDYAIEALELHYRLHASILKLAQTEMNRLDGFDDGRAAVALDSNDFNLFDELIEEASDNHFARREVLPFSQMEEKSDSQTSKHGLTSKLATVPSTTQTSLTMGCLIPDAVASALSAQLSVESDLPTSQSESSNMEEVSMDAEDATSKIPMAETQPGNPVSSYGDAMEGTSSVAAPRTMAQQTPLSDERRRQRASSIARHCVKALHLCLQRFPIHYKSLYRLAYLYTRCKPEDRHLNWARDILLNSDLPWTQLSHMPAQGLLSERNKTNLFNGVWKIPVDEIDRPGSFGWHLYRCVHLLLDILLQLHEHSKLLYLHNMLSKNPDQGKKYLRDADRISLSKAALSYSIEALRAKLRKTSATTDSMQFSGVEAHGDPLASQFKGQGREDIFLSNLLDAYKLYQVQNKAVVAGTLPANASALEPHKLLLIEAFQKYLTSQKSAVAPHLPVLSFEGRDKAADLEKAVKFCQRYSSQLKSSTNTGTSGVLPKKSENPLSGAADKETSRSAVLNGSGRQPQKFAEDMTGIESKSKAVESQLEACNIGAEKSPKTDGVAIATDDGKGQLVMVKKGSQTYTKITPSHRSPKLGQSPGSAFTPLPGARGPDQSPDFAAKVHKDPSLQHLLRAGVGHGKAPLLRSASMPVCVEDEKEARKVEEGVFRHRVLQRAGSISDYTKEKLKSSILMKTSASLVKKPSITDFELKQLQLDPDSSQSEDEDEEEAEEEIEKIFKPLNSENIPSTSASTAWEKNVVQSSPSPVITPRTDTILAVTTT